MAQESFQGRLFSDIYNQTSFQNEVRKQILDTLQQQPEGEQVSLAAITPFPWENVCIFGAGASSEEINAVIGTQWLREQAFVHEQRQILVFIQDGQVVQHLVFRPEIFGSRVSTSTSLRVCFSSSDAAMTIEGYDSLDGRIKLYILPDG